MINISGISQSSWWGKLLRFFSRLIPSSTRVPVLQGLLRGYWWIRGSGVDGYWLGTYEFFKQRVLAMHVKEGDVFYDIGAHVGFYTLLGAHLTKPGGRVFSFEPLPRNVQFIKKHLALNDIQHASVIEAALSNKEGTVFFDEGPNSFMGGIRAGGVLPVKSETLDHLFESGVLLPPSVIKIDAEGAEFDILQGAKRLLSLFHPVILLATHSPEIKIMCSTFLTQFDYTISPLGGDESGSEFLVLPRASYLR